MIAALGGLLFGYDTAVISGVVGAIDHNFITPRGLSETAANTLSGAVISCALIGCFVGGLLAGPISSKLGRRGGLFVAAFLFFFSSLGSAYPEFMLGEVGKLGPDALAPFIIYRFFGGIGIGLASMLSPMYIAEIAPPSKRGSLVTYQQIAIVGGILLVDAVNWYIVDIAGHGDKSWLLDIGWRYMLASCAIPAGLFFLLLFTVPETPRWLVMKGRQDDANKVLAKLTTPAEAQVVRSEIENSLRERGGKIMAFGAFVLVVGIMLSVFQQLVGINAVLYYGPTMFENMGMTNPHVQNVIVGATNVLFTLVALVTVDRWGRKPLLILGAVMMAVSMTTLGFLFSSHNLGTFAVLTVLFYIAGFALSWGPVVWVLLAEIFPNAVRSKLMAIAVAAQWFANFVVSTSFKVLDGSSVLNAQFNHGFAYWMYGAFSILAALFVWKYVPETKGRTLEDIQHLWKPVEKAS
jgi:SP family xylose:H+ symportor-like MFS transporter